MDKVKIDITLISKNCKSEEEINEIKSDINKIIDILLRYNDYYKKYDSIFEY